MIFLFLGASALPTPQHEVVYQKVSVAPDIELDVAFAGSMSAPHVVLFCHGYPENSWFWRGVIDPLLDDDVIGSQLLLVMPDQRGFNMSSKPLGIMSYNISHLVSDMAALATPLAKKTPSGKVHVVGHDWGGPVAWMVAGLHSDIVASLTIMNGPHPSVFNDLLKHNVNQQERSQYMLYFDTKAATDQQSADSLAKGFKGESWFDSITEAAYKAAWKDKLAIDSGLNWYRANVFGGQLNVKKFTADLNSTMPDDLIIPPPTLVLWGMKDSAFNNDANLNGLTKFVPKLTVKKYLTAAHWIAQEQPKSVAADIANFIAKLV